MTPVQIACAVLVPLLWGVQFVFIKTALTAFPPLFLLTLRFAILSVLLLPFVERPTRSQWLPLLKISLFMGGINLSLAFIGLVDGSAGNAAIAMQLSSPFALLLAWPLLGERPRWPVLCGVAVALTGVGLTARGGAGAAPLFPTLMLVGSAFSLAMGSVLAKRHGPFKPMMLLAWMSAMTVPQVFIVSVLWEGGQWSSLPLPSVMAWASLGYTVLLGGLTAFGVWFWLIGQVPMTRVAPFGLLQTIFGVLAGVLWLDEPLTSRLAVGMALCLAGVALSQFRPAASVGRVRRGVLPLLAVSRYRPFKRARD